MNRFKDKYGKYGKIDQRATSVPRKTCAGYKHCQGKRYTSGEAACEECRKDAEDAILDVFNVFSYAYQLKGSLARAAS